MNARMPAEVFPPGDFLKEELDKRGWTQVELSEILARPPRLISEIVSAKRAITPETAKGLAAALSTTAEFWMNLETSYRLSKASFDASNIVARRARLYAKFPIKEMLRRKWVEASDDLNVLEKNFCTYFSINSLDEIPRFKHAAKKTEYKEDTLRQLAWLNRAEQIAKTIKVGEFTAEKLEHAIQQLRGCLSDVHAVKKVPSILAKAGVRLVAVEYLPGAKLDGACFWVDNGTSPVIALSLRLDRLDNFWHTLFHELDHVLHGEGKDKPKVDVIENERPSATKPLSKEELRANTSAANYCIPSKALDEWLQRTGRVSSRKNIVDFACQLNVHPALVVGQLQHRGVIPYSFHRVLLEKVRSFIIESVVTDGFGNMPKV